MVSATAVRTSTSVRRGADDHAGDEPRHGQDRRPDRESRGSGEAQAEKYQIAGDGRDKDVIETKDARRIDNSGQHREGDQHRRQRTVDVVDELAANVRADVGC